MHKLSLAAMAVAGAISILWGGASRAAEQPVDLRVMTFNIWYGGQQVNFGQVVEAIRASHPDIVGIQEPDGGLRKIADALGWPYADERHDIISRYPLFAPPDAFYTYVQVEPGRFVAMANVHLPATPYGPEEVRDDKSLQDVLKLETETRLPYATPYIQALAKLTQAAIPVFLTGDFNSPSYLDWTPEAVKSRPQAHYAVEWPVSKAAADAGLRDSFREVHPDPIKDPGFTWTDGYPHPWIKDNETFDRIDFVWTGGISTTLSSEVVGEAGNPMVAIGLTPYPSDHRSVVSAFRVTPAPLPAMITADRRAVTQGEDILLRFNLAGAADGRAGLLPHGGDPAKDMLMGIATGDGSDRPSIKFGSQLLKPGAYDAVLLDPDGKELSRYPFWVLARDGLPAVETTQATFKPGEPIKVAWHNAPGMKHDWIAIYKAGDADYYDYQAYLYTGASIEGEGSFAPGANSAPRPDASDYDESPLSDPLPAGDYEVRLFRDDSYVALAIARFAVKAP